MGDDAGAVAPAQQSDIHVGLERDLAPWCKSLRKLLKIVAYCGRTTRLYRTKLSDSEIPRANVSLYGPPLIRLSNLENVDIPPAFLRTLGETKAFCS